MRTYMFVVDCIVRRGRQKQQVKMRCRASAKQPSGRRWASLSAPVPRQTTRLSVTAVRCLTRRRLPVRSSAEKRTLTLPSNNNALRTILLHYLPLLNLRLGGHTCNNDGLPYPIGVRGPLWFCSVKEMVLHSCHHSISMTLEYSHLLL